MTKNLRETIEREIKEIKEKTSKDTQGKGFYGRFYNNFFAQLPGGFRRLDVSKRLHHDNPRLCEVIERNYNIKLSEFLKENNFDNGAYSELILNQSTRDFHRNIDNVFRELKINPEALVKTQEARMHSGDPEFIYKTFEKEILEVYIKLREMGYKHYPDLTA